jgi:hypothetical protein
MVIKMGDRLKDSESLLDFFFSGLHLRPDHAAYAFARQLGQAETLEEEMEIEEIYRRALERV